MNRHLYQKCPKLRWLVFGDGTAETVHNAGAPRNQAKTPQSPVSREPVHPLQDYDPWSTGDTDKWPCWNTKKNGSGKATGGAKAVALTILQVALSAGIAASHK